MYLIICLYILLPLCRTSYTTATVNAAIALVKHLFSNLTTRLDFQVNILKLSVTILLYSLCLEEMNVEAIATEYLNKYQSSLQDWVNNASVIGGSFFGGRIYSNTLLYSKDEFEVHSSYVLF